MEAHIAGILLGLAVPVLVAYQWHARQQSFNYCLVDLLLQEGYIFAFPLQRPIHRRQRPLMPRRHIIHRLVEHELRVELIHGVVCEVHEIILQVGGVGLDVGLRGEASQSLLEDVHAKRVGPG